MRWPLVAGIAAPKAGTSAEIIMSHCGRVSLLFLIILPAVFQKPFARFANVDAVLNCPGTFGFAFECTQICEPVPRHPFEHACHHSKQARFNLRISSILTHDLQLGAGGHEESPACTRRPHCRRLHVESFRDTHTRLFKGRPTSRSW